MTARAPATLAELVFEREMTAEALVALRDFAPGGADFLTERASFAVELGRLDRMLAAARSAWGV
jgi:hypothetical protein